MDRPPRLTRTGARRARSCPCFACLAVAGLGFLAALLASACAEKQTPELPPKPLPPPLEYLGEWGVKGDGPGQLSMPLRLATDSVGNVFIADGGSRFIHKFDPRGRPLLSFQDEHLKKPAAIAVDRGGAIYVADLARNIVLLFRPDGTRIREIEGGPRLRFRSPVGVAVDDDGNLFVTELEAHRIQKLDPRGRLLKVWGKKGSGPGEFLYPRGIALDPDDFLYVVDAEGSRVQKFTRDGEWVASCGSAAELTSTADRLVGLAVSAKGMFVAAGPSGKVMAWTLDCQLRPMEDPGGHLQFSPGQSEPSDVAATPAGELLVLDSLGSRVLRFRVNF